MAYKVFNPGDEALAADVNTLLMGQTVARFTNAGQRTTQLPSPATNQLSMLDDRPGVTQRYSGSAWVDMPGVLSRWVAINPNVTAAAGTDITLTTFTMPFSGAVHMHGYAGCNSGAGATSVLVGMNADPGIASTPAPSGAVAGLGPVQPANQWLASFPFSALWASVASGVVVTVKVRMSSTLPGSMGTNVNALSAQILIVPTGF